MLSLAGLLITSKTQKQPRCPSVGEWINKGFCSHILEYNLAPKGSELSRQKDTWKTPTACC